MDIAFEIDFHTPFRVATGQAGNGADSTVDAQVLLPGSSLKGVMRAAAARLLPGALVDEVFGAPGVPAPWAWSAASFDHDPVVRSRIRIALEDGVAREGSMLVNEEVWADHASFSITQVEPIPGDRLADHQMVLEFAARSVHLLGADRRRGLGSVTVRPTNPTDPTRLAQSILASTEGGERR